jgi:NAD(P)-dependent dehydrogenase (short-subunit alcohol dehydrogenase family)
MLDEKHAVVFGGGGSIGAAVGKRLASEGAEVFLAGRTVHSVDTVAKEIEGAGGRRHTLMSSTPSMRRRSTRTSSPSLS